MPPPGPVDPHDVNGNPAPEIDALVLSVPKGHRSTRPRVTRKAASDALALTSRLAAIGAVISRDRHNLPSVLLQRWNHPSRYFCVNGTGALAVRGTQIGERTCHCCQRMNEVTSLLQDLTNTVPRRSVRSGGVQMPPGKSMPACARSRSSLRNRMTLVFCSS